MTEDMPLSQRLILDPTGEEAVLQEFADNMDRVVDAALKRDAARLSEILADYAEESGLRAERMAIEVHERRRVYDQLSYRIQIAARAEPGIVIQTLDVWLNYYCEQHPDVFAQSSFPMAREEARRWAEYASTTQLLTMLGACAIEAKARGCSDRAPQKHLAGLFKDLWAAFPKEWKRAFVDRVAKASDL